MNQKFHNIKIDLTKSTIPKVHILVQKILFEYGLTWISGGNTVDDTSFPYLFIYKKSISTCHLAGIFKAKNLVEVSIQGFLTEQYDSNVLLIVSRHMQEHSSGPLASIGPLPDKWVIQVTDESIVYINEFRSLLSPFFAPVTEKNICGFIGPDGEFYESSDKSETSYIISLDKFKFNVLYKLRAEKQLDKSFTLPEKWCVKVNADATPKNVRTWRGDSWVDEGYINYKRIWDKEIVKGETEITYEQFYEYIFKPWKPWEEKETAVNFVLPEKYCVAHHKDVADYINKTDSCSNFSEDLQLYSHFPKYKNVRCYKTVQDGYTKISIEQFREHVLTPMKTIEQKTPSTFVLPDAWCVAVEKNNEPSEVYEWRDTVHGPWSNKGYINSCGYHSTTKQKEFQLITFYQFVEHVLKPYRLKREEEAKIHYAKLKSTTQDVILKFDSDSKKSDTTFTLPEKYCVVHHRDVADYLRTLAEYKGWVEDLDLFTHFPPISEEHYCSTVIQSGYTKITIEQFREHVLGKPMLNHVTYNPVTFKEEKSVFVLPSKWYVKITEESRDALSTYRSTGGRAFIPLFSSNPGYIDNEGYSYSPNSQNLKTMTEITYEQFCEYVLGKPSTDRIPAHKTADLKLDLSGSDDKFVLPEKYCVVHHNDVADYINKKNNCEHFSEDLRLLSHFPPLYKNDYCYHTPQEGYTKITIEQFREHVLKTSSTITDTWYKEQLVTIETKETKEKPKSDASHKWNIGDWVVILKPFGFEHLQGKIAKIKKPTKDTPSHCVNVAIPINEDGGFNVDTKNIRAATYYEIEAEKTANPYAALGYNIGEWVVIVDAGSAYKAAQGKVVQVIAPGPITSSYCLNLDIAMNDFGGFNLQPKDVRRAQRHEIPSKSTLDLRVWGSKSYSPSISQSEDEDRSPLEDVIKRKDITKEELFKPKNNLNTIYHGKKVEEKPITIDLCRTYPSIARGEK